MFSTFLKNLFSRRIARTRQQISQRRAVRRLWSETLEDRSMFALDFAGTGFSVLSNSGVPGGGVQIGYTIENLASISFFDTSSYTPTFDFYLSTNNFISDFDSLLGSSSKTYSFFAPGPASEILTFQLPPASDPIWSQGQGTYYLGVVIDGAGAFAETDDSNNSNRGDGLDRASAYIRGGSTLTVDNGGDASDGNVAAGQLTLREAIGIANGNADANTINFDPSVTGTITLGGTELLISNPLTINGPGANTLAISGNDASRVFQVNDSTGSAIDVSMSGLTIRNGNTADNGGGVWSLENLMLSDVAVVDNVAALNGGGVDSNTGLTVVNSTIARNQASINGGGFGIGNGAVTIINTTISGNSANGLGGGLFTFSPITIRNSTITGNRADADDAGESFTGGGIDADTSNLVTIHNSIVAGNVTGTTAPEPYDAFFNVFATASSNNLIGSASHSGGLSNGTNGNLVGVNGEGTRAIGTILDPTLKLNGGKTPNHALVAGSAAIDAGSNAQALNAAGAALTLDQRGAARIVDGPDADTTATVDIGAFEARTPQSFLVDLATDESDGNFAAGDLSLREAIEQANLTDSIDTITFAANVVTAGTITLGGSRLVISNPVTITGPGRYLLTIDANNASQAFYIDGATNGSFAATIQKLSIRNGKTTTGGVDIDGFDSAEWGGGLLINRANLTLSDVRVAGSSSDSDGGGIYVWTGGATLNLVDSLIENNLSNNRGGGIAVWQGATINISGSTLSGNTAGVSGGAIDFFRGLVNTVTLVNSTLSGNSSNGGGGGAIFLASSDTLTIRNSTLVNNRANADDTGSQFGGAIRTNGANVTLHNTIIAGNVLGTASPVDNDVSGAVQAASSNNIIGDSGTAGGLTNGTNGNLVGVNGAGTRAIGTILNPALTYNGGKNPTHALVAGSAAIDAGDNAQALNAAGAALTLDQLGNPRTVDGPDAGTVATVDIGALESSAPRVIMSGTITYVENAAPLLLAPGGTVTDVDAPNFNGGSLTVTITNNSSAEDRLTITNQGTAAGQIGVSGSNVTYGGATFGTFTGGTSGSTPLVITFAPTGAGKVAVQKLLQVIAFQASGESPSSQVRTLTAVLNDGNGNTSLPGFATKDIRVTSLNDAPVIAGVAANAAYTENAAPTLLAATANLTDPDTTNFGFARLTATFTAGAEATDRLTVVHQGTGAGQVGVSGTQISVGGTPVATFVPGAGATTPLTITFLTSAPIASVQAVIRRIGYFSTSENPSTTARTVAIRTSDGFGGQSVPVNVALAVTAVNDLPTVVLGGTMGYVRNAPAVVLAAGATVTDRDAVNFNGGKLTVSITSGGNAGNTLDAGGSTFTFNGNDILLAGISVATITKSGFGLTDLEITFKTTATPAIVQQMVRAIRFRATTAAPVGARTISFTLTDGLGGTSAAAIKTVNVT